MRMWTMTTMTTRVRTTVRRSRRKELVAMELRKDFAWRESWRKMGRCVRKGMGWDEGGGRTNKGKVKNHCYDKIKKERERGTTFITTTAS